MRWAIESIFKDRYQAQVRTLVTAHIKTWNENINSLVVGEKEPLVSVQTTLVDFMSL